MYVMKADVSQIAELLCFWKLMSRTAAWGSLLLSLSPRCEKRRTNTYPIAAVSVGARSEIQCH